VVTDVTDCLRNMGVIEDVPEPVEKVDMTTLKIQEDNILGRGGFGVVYGGDIVVNDVKTPCAVKVPHYYECNKEQKIEAETLAGLNNKNVIKIFGLHEESQAIVLERAKISLFEFDCKIEKLPEGERLPIKKAMICQIINGLFHIFRRRIIHNDLYSRNILYKEDGLVKLADFGLVTEVPNNLYKATDSHDLFFDFENCGIPKKDMQLINKLFVQPNHIAGKEEVRRLRNDFIELYLNSKKWDCLSPEELAEKINPLLR
jgi:serine/threonine protein kinase